MIIEQHYDEEVLIGLLEEADHDSHVPGCDTCAGTLESLRDLTSALRDNSVWDERQLSETPAPKTTNMLRAFAERTKAEDAAAGPIVAALLTSPALLKEHPEWRTAGVVRGLLAHVDTINYTDPKAALIVASLAAEIAESIGGTGYPLDTLRKLRATAFREKAFALFFVGSFPESILALERADKHLVDCSVADCDRAEVDLLRARVYRDLEKFDESRLLARKTAVVFRRFGSHSRAAVAEAIEATLLVQMRLFREALTVDTRLAADMLLDEEARASALNRAAYSLRELSRFDEAKRNYAVAIGTFERLGLATKRAMARWGLGRVLLDEGRSHESALSMFVELRAEFEEFGLGHDLALVSLDAVEALIALNRPAEVVEMCMTAMDHLRKAGLAYSASAMTAIAYLREVAASGALTPKTVRQVRTYFEILPKKPNLLFAFPS